MFDTIIIITPFSYKRVPFVDFPLYRYFTLIPLLHCYFYLISRYTGIFFIYSEILPIHNFTLIMLEILIRDLLLDR